MLPAQPDVEMAVLVTIHIGLKDFLQPLLDALVHISYGILPHHCEHPTCNTVFAIPPNVICFSKAPSQRIKDSTCNVRVHSRHSSMYIGAVYEKNVIAMS